MNVETEIKGERPPCTETKRPLSGAGKETKPKTENVLQKDRQGWFLVPTRVSLQDLGGEPQPFGYPINQGNKKRNHNLLIPKENHNLQENKEKKKEIIFEPVAKDRSFLFLLGVPYLLKFILDNGI